MRGNADMRMLREDGIVVTDADGAELFSVCETWDGETMTLKLKGRIPLRASHELEDPVPCGRYFAGSGCVVFLFAYGRLERYQEEFIRIVNTDEFYADKLKKDVTWHFGAER